MTSPVPGVLAWPVLIVLTMVALGRWRLLGERGIDRLINKALTSALVALLLREGTIQQLLAGLFPPTARGEVVNFAGQLSFGALLMTVAYIHGVAMLWSGATGAGIRQRQRRYNLVATTATVVILVAGTPARRAGLLIDQQQGWISVVVWVALYLPLLATALLVGRIAVGELRRAGEAIRWSERLLIIGVGVIAGVTGLTAVADPINTVVQVVRHVPSADPHMVFKAWNFFAAAMAAGTVVAVPLIATLAAMTGFDHTGRLCRRLAPLWRGLTAAVPEVVLDLPAGRGRVGSVTRLHRMVIEINDSILHLHRYLPDSDAEPGRVRAVDLARAVDAKTQGLPPPPGLGMSVGMVPVSDTIGSGPHDLSAEVVGLLDLASVWPQARTHSAATHLDAMCTRSVGSP